MTETPLPADPELGAVVSHHPSNRLRPLIIAGLIGAPAMVILNFTLARSEEWYGRPLTVIIVAALGLALGWYILHIWNREIVLYERGLSYREGSETVFFVYPEIKSIRLRAERRAYFGGLWKRNVYRYTVTTIRDEQFIISNLYIDAADLGRELEARVNPILRQVIHARLADGGRVPFADGFAVSADGLHVETAGQAPKSMAWSDVGGFGRGNGWLYIRDSHQTDWHALKLAEIDNLIILLELLRSKGNPTLPDQSSAASETN